MEINEHRIKLSGTANIPKPLEMDREYDLTVSHVECDSDQGISNQNGTKDLVFRLKLSKLSEVNIISSGEIIKATKKGSQSQTLRFVLNGLADKYGEDREDYYNQQMAQIIEDKKNELYQ